MPANKKVSQFSGGPSFEFNTANGADRAGDVGPEDLQIVVDICHRSHSGAGVSDTRPLLDCDGGAYVSYGINIGLLDFVEELPGIGGKCLDVTPLPFRVNGIESEG